MEMPQSRNAGRELRYVLRMQCSSPENSDECQVTADEQRTGAGGGSAGDGRCRKVLSRQGETLAHVSAPQALQNRVCAKHAARFLNFVVVQVRR